LDGQTGRPVYVDNDANAGALAERLFGIGSETDNFVYIESGSGLGAGVIINGEVYRGGSGFGGEIGHMKVVPDGRLCHCGMKGCLSAYAADYALLAAAHAAGLSASDVASLAAESDNGSGRAKAIFHEAAEYLGVGLANVANILSPSLIVLGGSIARHSALFFDTTLNSFTRQAVPALRDSCRVEIGSQSDNFSSLGAIAVALQGCTSADAAEAAPWRTVTYSQLKTTG
jgi:predicted NBD/HSP70 family sugar kinase